MQIIKCVAVSSLGLENPTRLPYCWESAWSQLVGLSRSSCPPATRVTCMAIPWPSCDQRSKCLLQGLKEMSTAFPSICHLINPQNMEVTGSHISSMRTEVSVCLLYFINKETSWISFHTGTAASPECCLNVSLLHQLSLASPRPLRAVLSKSSFKWFFLERSKV